MRLAVALLAVAIVGCAVGASQPVVAQSKKPSPLELLVGAKSIRCNLDKGTQAAWDGGKLTLEPSSFGKGGEVTFDSIDMKAGTARIISNVSVNDAIILPTYAGITFVEQTAIGNVNFTTVFAAYVSSSSRRFVVVSSRHQNVNGPFPSQYHGTCSILE